MLKNDKAPEKDSVSNEMRKFQMKPLLKAYNFFSKKYITMAAAQSPRIMVLFAQFINPDQRRTQIMIVELLCQIA